MDDRATGRDQSKSVDDDHSFCLNVDTRRDFTERQDHKIREDTLGQPANRKPKAR